MDKQLGNATRIDPEKDSLPDLAPPYETARLYAAGQREIRFVVGFASHVYQSPDYWNRH